MSSNITLRSEKGSPLTNNEVDANFTNLNTDKLETSTADVRYTQISNNLSDLASASTALTNLGLTATATEINYTDGVTSAIQTQIDALQRPSIAVTVANSGSGNKFYLDGTEQQVARLIPSVTYKFDQSDSSNSGHPLLLSTTSDGTHGGGASYTVGVTAVGTPGSAGAYTEVKLEQDSPDTLYYYCSNHSGMGGQVTVRVTSVTLVDLGVNASASELNTLNGITASTSELNTLTGIPSTLTATELGYVDGVTSSIQTQIDSLGSSAGTTLTKTFTAGETSTMTLSDNVLVPVVSVTKEVAQSGVSNNAWDVNSSSENYTRYNTAPATTLDFDNYAIGSATATSLFSLSSQENQPQGITFKPDGSKMYVVGLQNSQVFQYSLSSAFDVTTASYDNVNKDVSSQDSAIRDVEFNTDGTKMFVVGDTNNSIYEYALTSAYVVSSASYTRQRTVGSQDTAPMGLAFNADGTKMFVLGSSDDRLYEYSVTSAFDMSTASYANQSYQFSSQSTNPGSVRFSTDGKKFFIADAGNGKVHEYSLSTGFDLSSTVAFVQSLDVGSQEGEVRGLAFNSEGTKLFIVGESGDEVNEYALPREKFILGSGSFASADVGKTIEANSGVFRLKATTGTFETVTSPSSFNQVASGSWQMYAVAFNTTDGDLELSSFSDVYNFGAQTQLSNSVTYSGSSGFSGATHPVAIHWGEGSKTRMVTTVDQDSDSLMTWEATAANDLSSFTKQVDMNISSQMSSPTGFCWADSGNKSFICDSSNIYQYNMGSSYEASGSYASKSLTGLANISGVLVSDDGTQLYACKSNGSGLYHYTMSTANDLSTASVASGGHFSLPSQSGSDDWEDMVYQDSGNKLYIIDNTKEMFEYNLSTAYRIETASFVQKFTVSSPGDIKGFDIRADGSRFYAVGSAARLYEFSIGAGVVIPSGYHAAHTTTSTDSTYWTDINSMTADEAAGSGAIYYCVSTDDRTTWKVAKGTDGERSIVRNNSGTWQYNSNGTYGSTTWANATTNAELAAIQEAMGTASNQMNKTQLDAIPDANHFTLANDLDLAIIMTVSSGSTVPSSDGVAINYDANVINQGAILGTDYNYDAPAQNKVRITSVNGANLKVRVI